MPSYFSIIIELISICFAIFFIGNKRGWIFIFIPYLLLTVTVELIGYVLDNIYLKSNHFIFNLYYPFFAGFNFWVLHHCINLIKKISGWIWFMLVTIDVLVYLIEFIVNKFTSFVQHTNIVTMLLLTIICCYYYYILLKQDKYFSLAKYYPFWLVSGIFIFCFGSTMCSIFYIQLMQIKHKYNIPIRIILYFIFNIFLYGFWSYSFVCFGRKKK
ncbi:MAG: hypothetical protein DI598_03170 [Pseudopedobacter saltans]|uniref:Uncharacterized protein n=1 Tax=Pseudopedobacter saltans TaxID=151895 RepID=A0A2W5F9A4_9SPHI|nr:MAG: hypothetical protein DI598_03170 [Pseudopedobacter saltans]